MDFSDFEYHKDKVPSDYKENERFFQRLEDKFFEEIMASPKAAEFFKNYHPDSIRSFVVLYAGQKAHLARSYSYYEELRQNKDLKFREKAEKVFEAIKQKKLFNLQLQWRAELITFKEISFSYDFVFWGEHINDCTFLPEIYAEDVELMKKYLLEDEEGLSAIRDTYDWQEHYDFMEKNEEGDYIYLPDWYEYYDNKMGTASLMLLPNKRGEKERFYEDLGRKEMARLREEEAKKNPRPPYVPPLPYLTGNTNQMNEFSKLFEKDKYFLKLFEIYQEEEEEQKKIEHDSEFVEEAIQLLNEADETVYMPGGGLEWRQAIIKCAQIYEARKVCDELDALYSEYRMFRELGISRGETTEKLKEAYENHALVKMIRDFILKGREMSGEPADLNF
jgi:hypothetical protein